MVGLSGREKKFDDMFSHYTIHMCDGQTERQTVALADS